MSDAADIKAGTAFVLPRSGTYELLVSNGAEHDVRYTLTLAIR
jgi:hypothetical protein